MVHLQLDRMPLSLFSDCDLHTQVSHTHTPHTHTHKDADRLRQSDSTNMQKEDEVLGQRSEHGPKGNLWVTAVGTCPKISATKLMVRATFMMASLTSEGCVCKP